MDAKEVSRRLVAAPVFLRNEMADVVIRSVPGTPVTFFAKFPGEKDWPIASEVPTVADALLEWDEITEAEYRAY